MAKAIWKGSILDTYNGNDKFAGENRDSKGVDKALGVDFLKQPYEGIESVDGFRTNIPAKGWRETDFKMVNMKTEKTNKPFDKLSTNTGFKWFNESGISPFNSEKSYLKTIDPKTK
jgi:hypothetical protein